MKRVFMGLLLSLVLLLVVASPVWAVANPNSVSIGDIYVFRNTLETGDILVFVRYDVDYTTEPSESAEDTFQISIYDTDGSTLLFTRPLNYYQHNIISIYLDVDDNTLTWESAYYIRITGSPVIFSPLIEDTNIKTRVLSSGDYRSTDDLGGIMITQAGFLEPDLGDLLTANDLLNITGSTYFLKAVPGLSSMVPEIFSSTTQIIEWERPTLNRTGINRTVEHLPVSLNSAITGLDAIFGVTNHNWGGFAWVLLLGMMVGGVIFGTTRRPDVAVLGGVMGTLGLGAYLGVAQGGVMLFVLLVLTVIVIIFAVGYFARQLG
ncbi:hypothetical protein LCGC14_0683610 [marine sediment metagenome]|uniref:Uncharacterized protein n=1 Tax=marine sediment metagenome TaxID=412755 RepID=A0A0F9QMK0_9ZZZZ